MSNVLSLHFNVTGPLRDAALECEANVFLSAFGNTRDQLAEEYGPYDDTSIFMAVTDDSDDVLGTCRLILPGAPGTKTIKDIGREPWLVDGERSARAVGIDPARSWDIATLGVRDGFRGQGLMVAMALYHGVLRSTSLNDAHSVTAIMDEHIRRVVATFGYAFPALPGTSTGAYLGSPRSTPVYYLPSMVDAHRRRYPDSYRLLALGIGLDGISLPSPDQFCLPKKVLEIPDQVVAA
jgi:hypothetical protein